MLTGRSAFDGESVAEILARVMEREPDWTLLPAKVPPRIRELLRLCLQKDSKKRRSDAADVRIDIEQGLAESAAATPAAAPGRGVRLAWITLTGLACLLSGGIIAGLAVWKMKPAPPLAVSRTVVTLSEGQRLDGLDRPAVALSPDGGRLAYIASDNAGTRRIFVRPIDSLEARPLAGTEYRLGSFFLARWPMDRVLRQRDFKEGAGQRWGTSDPGPCWR